MTRDLNDHVIYRCPVVSWQGQTMAAVHARYLRWLAQPQAAWDDAEEWDCFTALGSDIRDEGEFFLALLRHFDRDIYWHYVSANRDLTVVKQLLLNPLLLPGFNDSGAHVTNMAFYDGNLRALQLAAAESEDCFSFMVQRLTREPADFFGLDVGRIDIGCRADLTLLNPQQLAVYDGDAGISYQYRDVFDCHQLVNRSDGVVDGVYIAGEKVWDGSGFTPVFGRKRLGRALCA
jgi:N-acyl-D-aspartate/D-glutamate deacylase